MNHDDRTDLDRTDLDRTDLDLTDLDRALASALRRVDAPPALQAKFYALAAEVHATQQQALQGQTGERPAFWKPLKLSNGGRVLVMPRPRLWATGAIAAMLAVGVFTAADLHQRHQHAEQARVLATQQATQQFETATRITDRALAHTREQLLRAGVPLGD